MSFGTVLFIVLFFAASLVYTFVMNAKHSARLSKFVEEHPDAVKVQIKANKVGIIVENLQVITVNGETPILYSEMFTTGFYLLPGKNILEVSYEWTRPGILHKSVTTYFDPCKIEVEAEPNKTYKLSYNRKQNEYVFEEVQTK